MKHANAHVLIGLLTASLSMPAHAAWESVYSAGPAFGGSYSGKTRNCEQSQEKGPAMFRNIPDTRLVLGGGSSRLDQSDIEYLEVYGLGIDLSPTVSLSGFSPTSIRIVDRINGVFNAAHFCGAIGSIVVELSLQAVAQNTNATLRIGSESIPVTIASQNRVRAADWSTWANTRTASGSTGSTSGRSGVIIVSPPATCVPGPGVTCPGAGNSVQVLPDLRQATPPPPSLGRCITDLGGTATVSGDLLTVVMPDVRTGVAACFALPAFAGFTMETSPVAATSSAITNPSVSVLPAAPAARVTIVPESRASNEKWLDYTQAGVELRLPATDFTDFTGRRVHTLTATGAGGTARSLRLAVQSMIPSGVTAIRPPVAVPGMTGRPNNTLKFELVLAQAAESGQRFSWQVNAVTTSAAPNSCFTTTAGTEAPPIGATVVPVTLTVSGTSATCDGRSFSLTAQPAGATAPIYQRSQAFTVLPLANLPTQLPTPNVAPNLTRP